MKIIWSKYGHIKPVVIEYKSIFQMYFPTEKGYLLIIPDLPDLFLSMKVKERTLIEKSEKYIKPFEDIYLDILYKISEDIYDSYLARFNLLKEISIMGNKYIKELL